MKEKHPTYKHPIIQEALCALHFNLGENREWKSSFFGDFYRSIESDYPHIEPGVNVGVEFHVKESEISQVLSQPRQMMKFTHTSGKKLMQLFPHMLTINELPVYPGWKEMSDDIIHALNNLQKTLQPIGMNKIGLRYINRLAKAHNKEKAADWFVASSYVSEALISSLPGFLSRLVFNPSPHMMIIVTMGDKTNGNAEDASSIVLDIDCILEQPMTMDENALMKALDELHDKAWDIFSSSMTPRLEKLLKEGRA